MRLDQNPVFRKVIVPWYDSDAACFILIACMCLVILFGFTGILAALENTDYQDHVWVPALLIIMSTVTIITTAARLAKRYFRRYSK